VRIENVRDVSVAKLRSKWPLDEWVRIIRANPNGVTLSGNRALGGDGGTGVFYFDGYTNGGNGGNAFGGGIDVAGGSVTLSRDSLANNTAQGGQPGTGGIYCGSAYGGAISVVGGTVTLISGTVESNAATGGVEPPSYGDVDGVGYGGGLYVSGGTVTMCSDTVESNSVSGGHGFGGGIYVASGATIYIDVSSVDPVDRTVVTNNTDDSGTNGSTANIDNQGTLVTQNC
jgi:hypothetical protein